MAKSNHKKSLSKSYIEILKIDQEIGKELKQLNIERKFKRRAFEKWLYSIIDRLDSDDGLREAVDEYKRTYDCSDETAEKMLKDLLRIRDKHVKQAELVQLREKAQAEYKFEQAFRQLYTIFDIPDNEWFETDKNGNPASNAKNIALALKRLPLCEITFKDGSASIIYNNYPIRLENAPIFFSHVIRDAFKFIPRRDQFARAIRLLRG